MQAHRGGEAAVRIVTAPDERREAIFAAKEINRQIGGIDMLDTEENEHRGDSARSFSDIAILYRTHRQAAWLEKTLRQEGHSLCGRGKRGLPDAPGGPRGAGLLPARAFPGGGRGGRACPETACPVAWGGGTGKDGISAFPNMKKKIKRTKPVRLLEEMDTGMGAGRGRCGRGQRRPEPACGHGRFIPLNGSLSGYAGFRGGRGRAQKRRKKNSGRTRVTLMTLHGSKGLSFPW